MAKALQLLIPGPNTGARAALLVHQDYATPQVNKTNCNGKKFIYQELAGWGVLPSDARDRFGDTIGGIGSAIALDKKSWK
ncbi:hypothetical protein PMIN04_001557 [Paraphaeosphaeria minitans]